jgi:hypothetical protein
MPTRRARDDEVERWRERRLGPHRRPGGDGRDRRRPRGSSSDISHAEQYHADPEGETLRRRGVPPPHDGFVWPEEGPGFRDEQHLWQGFFPFPGSGALNRLVVQPGDRGLRRTGAGDDRLSACTRSGMSAKYTGITNYEQPMHTDRNHSWLPPVSEAPWRHIEGFLYLSDVSATGNPTHLVSVQDSGGRPSTLLRRSCPMVTRISTRSRKALPASAARISPIAPMSFTGPSNWPSRGDRASS